MIHSSVIPSYTARTILKIYFKIYLKFGPTKFIELNPIQSLSDTDVQCLDADETCQRSLCECDRQLILGKHVLETPLSDLFDSASHLINSQAAS